MLVQAFGYIAVRERLVAYQQSTGRHSTQDRGVALSFEGFHV